MHLLLIMNTYRHPALVEKTCPVYQGAQWAANKMWDFPPQNVGI